MSSQPAPTTEQKRAEELTKLGGEALQETSQALALPTSAAPLMSLGNQGVVLNQLNDAWMFANLAFNSKLVPESLKSPAQVLIALQMGLEVGLPPMAAIQNIAVINGRPSLWGDIMLGLCRASGKFDEAAYEETWEGEGETLKAICTVRRLPNGKPIVREFTWKEAVTAGLTGKDTYKKYPKRMLQSRARAFALRDGFSDVLKGVISAEEARDLPPVERNITPAAKPESLADLQAKWAPETPALGVADADTQTAAIPSLEDAVASLPAIPETAATEDPLAAIRKQLEECRTVPDVTRVRNSLTGPASKASDQEKADLNAMCESRAAAIRAERKGGTQAALPQG